MTPWIRRLLPDSCMTTLLSQDYVPYSIALCHLSSEELDTRSLALNVMRKNETHDGIFFNQSVIS